MIRGSTARALSVSRRGATLLALVALAACKHSAGPVVSLKATATGTAIIESSGNHQVGAAGTVLKDPVVVQVNDDQGTPVPGALVAFHGSTEIGFDPAEMLTDSSGQATTAVTLGTTAGRYRLTAITPGKSKPVSLDLVETALGYQERLGSVLAEGYCSRCHDPESSPQRVSNFDNLEVKPHPLDDGNALNKMTDADLTSVILHGGPALNRSALMPPYGKTLSAADVRALIAYIRAVADPPYEPARTVYARK